MILLHKDRLRELGGAGSGNFGHVGRPGERGGSGEGGGSQKDQELRTAFKDNLEKLSEHLDEPINIGGEYNTRPIDEYDVEKHIIVIDDEINSASDDLKGVIDAASNKKDIADNALKSGKYDEQDDEYRDKYIAPIEDVLLNAPYLADNLNYWLAVRNEKDTKK